MDQKIIEKLKSFGFNGLAAIFCTLLWSKLVSIENKLDQIPLLGYRVEQLEKKIVELESKKVTVPFPKPLPPYPASLTYEFIIPDEKKLVASL